MSEPAATPVTYSAFAHLNVDKPPLYRAILGLFVAERARFVISLRPSEIQAALAASRLGPRCAPLVCVNGQFATPVKILLRQVHTAGARLHYHGDFDTGGLAIAHRVFGQHHAHPWRMNATDYLTAPKGKPIAHDAALPCPWDPDLSAEMRIQRKAVHEEAVANILSADLSRPPPLTP